MSDDEVFEALRLPLLRYFGTTDPELLVDVWESQATDRDSRNVSTLSPRSSREETPALCEHLWMWDVTTERYNCTRCTESCEEVPVIFFKDRASGGAAAMSEMRTLRCDSCGYLNDIPSALASQGPGEPDGWAVLRSGLVLNIWTSKSAATIDLRQCQNLSNYLYTMEPVYRAARLASDSGTET